MILQQLQKDADYLVGDLPPSMYDWKPVKWVVHLDGNGRAHWPPEQTSGAGKKDRGKMMLVPFRTRTSAVQPLLLADKATYTWGVPPEHKRAAEEHAAYLDLLRRCAAETGRPDVAAVARFLETWDAAKQPLPADFQPDELTTFAVDGRYPVEDADVRAFWSRAASAAEGQGTPGHCLVCGCDTRLVERLPVPLKGIPQGQSSGVALVSANATAFESYGRAAALTSPICLRCGERFGKAANALLQDKGKHLTVGPVAYLFWAPAAEIDIVDFLSSPDPEQVRNLLRSAQAGRLPAPGDDSAFYATALSAYTSRAVVRSWLDTTVGAARRNLERWFRLQRIVDPYGGEGAPLSVFRLAVSPYREAKDIVARAPGSLLQTALYGGALPTWLLQQAVLRNQAEQAVTYPRAALIKAVLCAQGKEDTELMSALNSHHPSPAYQCGRLLAELEAIQQLAVRGIKATLVDRYYTGASCSPARVFGHLLNGTQAHLGKLRKERPGAYTRLSESLEAILSCMDAFPRTLTVQDQALFSLGYYHQRAQDRAARREAAEAKRAAGDQAVLTLTDTEENGYE